VEPHIDHLTPLTPLAFLARSARVYGDRIAVRDGVFEVTYAELAERARRLAGALRESGVEPGDRVAVLSPNSHVLLESHYGVPASGAALVALNTRLAPAEIGDILDHSGANVLIHDESLRGQAQDALGIAEGRIRGIEAGTADSTYERILSAAAPVWAEPSSETAMLSINYTSGTTGAPKGVVYHHRGAYLQSLAMAFHSRLGLDSVYLWTLPMFHTNGWCFPWAVTAAGSVHRCLRRVDPEEIWRAIREEGVTHLCAAPTVLLMLADHPSAGEGSPQKISVMTGGAPPTPALLEQLARLNIEVVHLYGLTETFGPAAICDWRPEWNELPAPEQARMKARQGVENVISQPLRVVDAAGADVPLDGSTIGEITITGNNLMAGYYLDEEATRRAIPDGWFRTGDLAVMHTDGYVEIVDRAKDIIISGGENISSLEVERVLARHPAVYEAAVVGVPDAKWGEAVTAVVELRPGAEVSESELIEYVKSQLARYKAPKRVAFEQLPRTSTGKIQKHRLRADLSGDSAISTSGPEGLDAPGVHWA